MRTEYPCKILVIEDDAGICRFLRATLTAAHYDVIVTDTGKKALEIVSSHCPDCILLDLGLPDVDGNDIIQSIRGWTKTPIIVISARSTEEDKARALDLGADDYLTKPFGSIELIANHEGNLGAVCVKRQQNPPRAYGQHPPQNRTQFRRAAIHLHRGRRGLPHGGRGKRRIGETAGSFGFRFFIEFYRKKPEYQAVSGLHGA